MQEAPSVQTALSLSNITIPMPLSPEASIVEPISGNGFIFSRNLPISTNMLFAPLDNTVISSERKRLDLSISAIAILPFTSMRSHNCKGVCRTSCMGGAASPLPTIRCRMGNEDVAPPWFCKCLSNRAYSSFSHGICEGSSATRIPCIYSGGFRFGNGFK